MTSVRATIWRPSRLKSILAAYAYPIFLLLNRPSMTWFGDLLYDIALRFNGIAITFAGNQGLTRAEEHFLDRNRAKFEDGVLFDIGANHGAYARFLNKLAPAARIFAFEPHPATFASLALRMKGLPEVRTINKAVADEVGRRQVYDFQLADGSTQARALSA